MKVRFRTNHCLILKLQRGSKTKIYRDDLDKIINLIRMPFKHKKRGAINLHDPIGPGTYLFAHIFINKGKYYLGSFGLSPSYFEVEIFETTCGTL